MSQSNSLPPSARPVFALSLSLYRGVDAKPDRSTGKDLPESHRSRRARRVSNRDTDRSPTKLKNAAKRVLGRVEHKKETGTGINLC